MKYVLHVKTKAREESISPRPSEKNSFDVRTKESPREGKANIAIINLLADYLSVWRSQMKITQGLHRKTKIVEISDRN